ncbi:MAG: hypothetical protein JO086_07165 [Acidimicrobiia bacterium]|nr:hypothetical protein [Acidimicrobiia bacterium]
MIGETPAGGVHIALYHDTPGSGRWVRALGKPREGLVVADVFDHERGGIFDLAEACLDGLGKDGHLHAAKSRSESLAAAWIRALDSPHVLIPDAQLMASAKAATAAGWLAGLGAQVWLGCATPAPRLLDERTRQFVATLRRAVDAQVCDQDALAAVFERPPSPVPPVPDPWPRLPRCDGLVFRSACERLLRPADAARVDAEFVAVVRRVHEALPVPGEESLHQRRIWPLLRREIEAATSPEHVVLVVRAAQVACLARGWHMAVDGARLVAAAHLVPTAGKAAADGTWEALDHYVDPDPGAAASLYLAGFDAALIGALTVGAVEDAKATDGALRLRLDDACVVIDNPGTRFVRILADYRRLCGAGPDDALFVTHRASRVTPRHVVKLLRTPAAETGTAIARGRVERGERPAEVAVRRYGIELRCVYQTRWKNPEPSAAAVAARNRRIRPRGGTS